MTVEMTYLPITKELFKRVERLASLRNQDVSAMLDELLSWVEADDDSPEARMSQEEEAFRTMLPTLQSEYLGQYVAIFQGEVVDHDSDELSLLERVERALPGDVVLLKLVSSNPERPLVVRSPRLVPES